MCVAGARKIFTYLSQQISFAQDSVLKRRMLNHRKHVLSAFLCGLLFLFCTPGPAQKPPEPPPQTAPFTIKTDVNIVLVPVLVLDSQGHGVANLTKNDFQVFDRGKLQTITGFTIQKRAVASPPPSPTTASSASPTPIAPSPQPAPPPDRSIVFLFDDMHIDAGDLLQIKAIASKMIAASLAPSDMAAIVSFTGTYSGLTRDRSRLQAAIDSLHMQSLYRHASHQCPDVDYYQGD